MNDGTAIAVAGGALVAAAFVAQRQPSPTRRVRGGQLIGIPPEVARHIDVSVNGRRQATVQGAARAGRESLGSRGRVTLGVRDRRSRTSVDCTVKAPRGRATETGRASGGTVACPPGYRERRGLCVPDSYTPATAKRRTPAVKPVRREYAVDRVGNERGPIGFRPGGYARGGATPRARIGTPSAGRHDPGLPASAYAYVDRRGGRHLPLNTQGRVRAALGARFQQTAFESKAARCRAARAIVARAERLGIRIAPGNPVVRACRSVA